MSPIRVTYNQACGLLNVTRNALRELSIKDPSFPKGYKAGTTRQAPVYFDYEELVSWHKSKFNAIQ